MTELNLLYGSEDNLMSDSNDRNENVYSSKVSGQQLHKMASQNDMGYEDKISKQQMMLQQHSQHSQHSQQQPKQIQQPQISQMPPPPQNPQFQTQSINQQGDNQGVRRRVEYNFMDRMNLKKGEVLKLALFSLVIVLGISVDRMITHYLSKYLGDNSLTDFQEFLLRFSYPIGIFLALWIFKAI
jgi:hypothetical protein